MTEFRTDEEQAELVKKWWRENGKSLLLSVAVVLASWTGWNAYQNNQQATREQASALYSQLTQYASKPKASQTDGDKTKIQTLAAQLSKEFDGTVYADLARLISASMAIDAKDYSAGGELLRAVVDGASDGAVKYTATIRLANVLIQNKDYDGALALLEKPMDAAYKAQALEAKGDALYFKGQVNEAMDAYKQALASAKEQKQTLPVLQRKVDSLSSQLGQTSTEES